MKNKHFEEWEFKKIVALFKIDPYASKIKFEHYLQRYPKDYSVHSYYAYNLLVIGEYKEAERVLNWIELNSKSDSQFLENSKFIKEFMNNLILNKIRLLSYQERYEELLKLLYQEKIEGTNDFDFELLEIYCKKKLGLLDIKRDGKPYLIRQLVLYDEYDFLDHILKHTASFYRNTTDPEIGIFDSTFPLKSIINEVKKYIPSEKAL